MKKVVLFSFVTILSAMLSVAAVQETRKSKPQTPEQKQQRQMEGHMGMNMMEMCSMMMDRTNEEMSGQCLSMMLKGKQRESLVKALRTDKELLSSLKSLINEAQKKK